MPAEQTAVNPLIQLMPFFIVFMIFYFLIIRPQNKKQKDLELQRKSIQKNDEVITAGGMHGLVTLVKERTVILRVDDNVKIEFEKDAIATIIKK